MLDKLEMKVDCIEEIPLRRDLSERIMGMRRAIRGFDEEAYLRWYADDEARRMEIYTFLTK